MENLIKQLQRDVRVLKLYCMILTIILVSFVFLAFTITGDKPEIVRVRGIIVEDESGKERILIGAPIPEAKNRIRSDFEKAKNAWGTRFPNFDWYKSLTNTTNGIVILDDQGYDKIAIGDPVPDPNIGKRIAPSVGIAINDNEGFERTGWGFFPQMNRVGLGLDNDKGTEGVMLNILEDGSAGIMINSRNNKIYLGDAPANSIITGLSERFQGLFLQDSSGINYKVNTYEKK